MNDSELDRLLKAAKTPARPAEYWTQFPQRVAAKLHWRTAAPARPRPSRGWRLAWTMTAAAACLAIGFLLWPRGGRTEADANGLLQNGKVIKETLALFPNQLRAIEQDEHGLRLVLSEKNDVPASPPLWVKVCNGRHCLTVVTFSGQEVQVGGQRVTVLSDAQGGVLLVGTDFVWSSEERSGVRGNLKIEARTLGSVAM